MIISIKKCGATLKITDKQSELCQAQVKLSLIVLVLYNTREQAISWAKQRFS